MAITKCYHRTLVGDDEITCGHPAVSGANETVAPLSTCDGCFFSEAKTLRGLGDLIHAGLIAIGITTERVTKVIRHDCGCGDKIATLNELVPFGVPDTSPPAVDLQTTVKQAVEPPPCANCKDEGTALKAAAVPEERTEEHAPDSLQFVWVYWHGGAAEDELRFSIRSVEQNYQGNAHITVVGDKPMWYDGHRIKQNRQKSKVTGFERGLRDVLSKMHTISRHPDIDDEFVWMMDDVFMVRATSYENLITPRAGGEINQTKGNRWRNIKGNTGRRLQRNKFSIYDYGTHLPHHIEKAKLQEMFSVWKPLEHVFLWEVAYSNIYKKGPQKHVPFLRRVSKSVSGAQYDKWATRNNFFNVMSKGWNESFRNWLVNRFPTRSSVEDGANAVAKTPTLNEPVEDHYLLIQSAYDTPELSSQRLDVTEATIIPSLTAQTAKVKLVVSINESDPFLLDRQALFDSTGHDVSYVEKGEWDLPVGPRNLVGRIDDDDVIPMDFLKLSREMATFCAEKGALIWPNGYIFYKGKFYRWHWPGNQFIALVSRDGSQPYAAHHQSYLDAWPVVIAENSRGWVWIRHDSAITGTRRKYLKKSGGDVNFRRFVNDFDKITEVLNAQIVTPTDGEIGRNNAGGVEWRRDDHTVERSRGGLQGLPGA
jgi:hypothetical protein